MGRASDVNRAFYGTLSDGRDDYWRKMAAPRYRVATFLRLLSQQDPRSVVDLGCGNGRLLQQIRSRLPGVSLAGIDLSQPQIAANRQRMPAIAWQVADLTVPGAVESLDGKSFDAVVAAEIIEHVDDPLAFLTNARQLADPRGRLLLSTQSGRVGETERRAGHRRHFRAGQMRDLLRQAGWIPVRVWNAGFPFHDLSKWYANLDPDRTMEQFGRQAYGWKQSLVCLGLGLAFRFNSRRRGAQLFAVARRGH